MKKTTVGIIAAKKISKRFPNKNIHKINGVPMFWYSVAPLLESKKVDKVYVATDSDYIREYCKKNNVDIIWRTTNATHNDEPLLDVLKCAYKQIDKKYDNIVTVMANCPNHTTKNVDKIIDLINEGHFMEIRSFNNQYEESGLMIFKEDVILNKFQISSYVGAISVNIKEIHSKKDL